MDASKKLNLAETKTYISDHITLTAAQKTAALAAFDKCMVSPPQSSSTASSESQTAFKCMIKGLVKNVSSVFYIVIF